MLEHFSDCEASTLGCQPLFVLSVDFAFIFLIVPRYHVGSPLCLRMGSCELPHYASQFDDDEELVCEDEPHVLVGEPVHEGSAEETETVDVCVVKPDVPSLDRAAKVATPRTGKKVSKEAT